jgi:hypothetical protein
MSGCNWLARWRKSLKILVKIERPRLGCERFSKLISDDVEQTASEPDAAGDDGAALGEAIRALPKKNGRPYSLNADDKTLKMVQGLGAIQATTLECAAVLNVNESTFVAFLAREPEAREAFEIGKGKGKISLRRLSAGTRRPVCRWLFISAGIGLIRPTSWVPSSPARMTDRWRSRRCRMYCRPTKNSGRCPLRVVRQ